MALQVTSCTLTNKPDKLLDKGASYFRQRTNRTITRSCGRRKSAVELLEASKAQYVKSSHVLEHRQEPGHGSGETGHMFISTREKFPRCSKENDGDVPSLPRPHKRDRKLRYSIGACENIPNTLRPPTRPRPVGKLPQSDIPPGDITISVSAPTNMAAQSLDPSDKLPNRPVSPRCRQLISSSTVITAGGKESVHGSIDLSGDKMLRRQKAIHRSQSDLSRHSRSSTDFSDLSSRVSRTSAELERFFNEMGLDKTVIDPLLRKQSQSFSDFDILESMSSMGSPDARSACSGVSKSEKTDHTGPDGEKPISSTSVVERNARIIKWLCNVKKARSIASSTDKSEATV